MLRRILLLPKNVNDFCLKILNFASSRKWYFIAQMVRWHCAVADLRGSIVQRCLSVSFIQGRTQGGGLKTPLSLIFYNNFIIRRVYWAWFFTKIRGVYVEEYAYYVNKLRWKTWIRRQIVTSQTAHTKYKLPPSATEWNPPWKFSTYATGFCDYFCSGYRDSSEESNMFMNWNNLFSERSENV